MGAIGSTNNLSLISNNISGTRNGIGISQFNSTGRLSLVNNIVASTFTGVQLSSINTPPTVTVSGGSISGSSQIGLFYIGNGTATDKISVNDLSLVNNVVGMDVSAVGGNLQMEFSGVTINGGITGIRFYGTQLSLPGNTLSGVSFSNQSQEYILQTSHSFEGQTIDASTVSFDGITPASMTLAQLFATEDKLTHKIDFDSVGYFGLRANEVFVTPNSFAATLPPVFGVPTTTPDINRAVRSADPGNIIHIAAGVYANQVTLDKGVSLIGEGQNVTSIILPATPAVPPPGPFTEIGVIQTAQNIGDVHISNLSVTGNPGITPIIIQSGGSVQNCAVQNGNQGIFFRAETGIKTVTIENNLINAEYIGVNTQGPGMTTSLLNNTITVANQDFS